MTATPLTDVAVRLRANVEKGSGDLAERGLLVPAAHYRDPDRWHREMEMIYRRVPVVVAMSCDLVAPGDRHAVEIAERPIVVIRGDDGVARTFLNVCRHRGAPVACTGFDRSRRLTCPYHNWVYDTQGALVGVPHRETFGDIEVTGLVELATQERVGLIFAVLTPGAPIDVDEWLGEMADSLAILRLDALHRFDAKTELQSGNWKATADGYVDGYHLGFLHSANIGLKSITNRNTYDCYGPHVRIGFANKPITAVGDKPVDEWVLPDVMSLVHFVFPNISLSGQEGRPIMMSMMLPGPTVDRSTVMQYHYTRNELTTAEERSAMDERRLLYAAVTRDEDFSTVLDITHALDAMAGEDFRFGRNEAGNQNLHRWVDALLNGAAAGS